MIRLKYLEVKETIPAIQTILMIFILLLCSCYFIYKIYKKINIQTIIISDVFWLTAPWLVCLMLYFFSGIIYKIKLDLMAFCYIFIFWGCYFCGKYIVKYRNQKLKQNNLSKELKLNKKINFNILFIISLLSVLAYIAVIFYYNPGIKIGITRNVNTNFLSTIFHVLSSCSLIIWMYELIYSLIKKEKMKYYAIPSAIIYNIPGIVIAGRDALMIFFLATIIIFIFSMFYLKKKKKKTLITKKLKKGAIVVLILLFIYLIFISNTRYGSTSDSILNLYRITTGAKFPKYLLFIYEKTGPVGKLLMNFVFYYSSQFSKFALVFNDYKGPYQLGLHQLHYVGRLFTIFGYNPNAVSNSLEMICNNVNLPDFKNFWETIIGYSIIDFGRIGSLLYAFILGFSVEKILNKCKKDFNEFSIITITMICVGLFTTVEISPLFDYFYIFPIFWLIVIIIYRKKIKLGGI